MLERQCLFGCKLIQEGKNRFESNPIARYTHFEVGSLFGIIVCPNAIPSALVYACPCAFHLCFHIEILATSLFVNLSYFCVYVVKEYIPFSFKLMLCSIAGKFGFPIRLLVLYDGNWNKVGDFFPPLGWRSGNRRTDVYGCSLKKID